MKENKRYQQLKNISEAAVLEESRHIKLMFRAVIFLFFLIVALIVWAGFAKVKEIALTYGQVEPSSHVQVVQHLEGGIVSTVLVRDGEKIKKGQLLVKFDPSAVKAELKQMQSREITLVLNRERLRAFLDHKPANVVKWSKEIINSKYNTVKNREQIVKLLATEKELLRSQNKQRLDQISTLEVSIKRSHERLQQTINEKEVWDKQVKLLSEEFEMYRKLKKNKYVSHRDYLVILRDLNRAKGERVRLLSDITQTRQTIAEERNKLAETKSKLRQQALKEYVNLNDDLLETRHQIEKIEDKYKRTSVKAPIAGIVKGLEVAPGNVVKPGALLLEVVPFGENMIVESQVNPRDIGHISVGDAVTVKVLTYDFARYGSIKGRISKISASTFKNKETGKPYYLATTVLDKQFLGSDKSKKQLIPGMTVEASIITGEKTLLQYLLKPIHRSTNSAFSER